ncbi:hypothetical protein K432DRAFT_133992 [Lepidopterella palustris CBS 459.81]|uniref:Uncharacterized protein n=1 Tax=Lepidopterella palustris CBS 459.81 TaxID=1314670 RepID=A0A8E2EI68_9PEZI|nr:hypothetical protein K432DRAFT_133992 [Lepidopterella palustris CBS 459.81]
MDSSSRPAPDPAARSPSPYSALPRLPRCDTQSTTNSIPFSILPAGFYQTRLQGSCPRCHHFHNRATLRLSRNPAVFNGIRCERCGHKWFSIGGNSTHTSLISQETSVPDTRDYEFVRSGLLQTLRSMSAVGSPTLSIVPEDRSPVSRQPSQRIPSDHSRSESVNGGVPQQTGTDPALPGGNGPSLRTGSAPLPNEGCGGASGTSNSRDISFPNANKPKGHSFKSMRSGISRVFKRLRNIRFKRKGKRSGPKSNTRDTLATNLNTPSAKAAKVALFRRGLTEARTCTCGPSCQCHCRRRSWPECSFAPNHAGIDSFNITSNLNEDHRPPIQLTLRDSIDFHGIGDHFNQHPISISSLAPGNRYSIGTYVSSNFSTAGTAVESERSMTTTSGPWYPRAHSLPRTPSRSSRILSPPPPPSRLRNATTIRQEDSTETDSTQEELAGRRSTETDSTDTRQIAHVHNGIDGRRTPTQLLPLINGLHISQQHRRDERRGRSPSRNRQHVDGIVDSLSLPAQVSDLSPEHNNLAQRANPGPSLEHGDPAQTINGDGIPPERQNNPSAEYYDQAPTTNGDRTPPELLTYQSGHYDQAPTTNGDHTPPEQ